MIYFFSIFFGTFIIEDLALASAIALATEGKLSMELAFIASFLGILVSDVAYYGLGVWATHMHLENKFSFIKKNEPFLKKMKDSNLLGFTIILSRVLPGTRVPTYFTAGYLKYSFLKFFILTFFSVLAWVILAFSIGSSIQAFVAGHWAITFCLMLLIFIGFRYLGPMIANRFKK